jgi:hypothetical protein
MLQALNFVAGRARAVDLKLRLALRVAALAAACFLAVAAYALFDSNRRQGYFTAAGAGALVLLVP